MHRLYVYSGTGNTLHIAETVAKRLGGETEIHNMAKMAGTEVIGDGDTVGVFYPVHAFGAPAVVHRFLSRFRTTPSSWVYLVIDSAGMPLGAASQGAAMLKKNGISLMAVHSVRMPGNYPPLYNPPSGEKLKSMVDKTDRRIGCVADKIFAREANKPFGGLRWLTEKINGKALRLARKEAKRFFSTDDCSGCRICLDVCPVKNITLTNEGRPKWHGECTGCLACFHWCPCRAIQYNKTSSMGRNRYRHPKISRERYLRWCGGEEK